MDPIYATVQCYDTCGKILDSILLTLVQLQLLGNCPLDTVRTISSVIKDNPKSAVSQPVVSSTQLSAASSLSRPFVGKVCLTVRLHWSLYSVNLQYDQGCLSE